MSMNCEIHKYTELFYNFRLKSYFCPICRKIINEALEKEIERVNALYTSSQKGNVKETNKK